MKMENMIGHKILWFDELESTNDFASTLVFEDDSHGKVIAARYQSKGRGQRGTSWEGDKDKSLLFSVILHPTYLKVKQQFLLSMAVALSICDVLDEIVGRVFIKWPNDIFIGTKKGAGILIEHSFSSEFLDTTIVGVGINVNQQQFTQEAPNATSLFLETGEMLDIEPFLNQICAALELRMQQLRETPTTIKPDYLKRLFRRDEFYRYRASNEEFVAKIVGVKDSGELLLKTEKGEQLEFFFKEIEYVI